MTSICKSVFLFISFVSVLLIYGGTADLESKNVREGNSCKVVSPDNVAYDDAFIFSPKRYYLPVASKHNYYLQTEVLLNRPARNEEELEMMCRSVEVNFQGSVLERGYDNSVTQTCVPLPRRGQFNCTTTFASAGSNIAPFEKYVISILATDNKTYALMTRCTNDSVESYQLLTTTPDLKKTTTSLEEVRSNITKLGFNPDYTIAVGCRKCDQKV